MVGSDVAKKKSDDKAKREELVVLKCMMENGKRQT
jgi:hypothetical protein